MKQKVQRHSDAMVSFEITREDAPESTLREYRDTELFRKLLELLGEQEAAKVLLASLETKEASADDDASDDRPV